MHLFRFLSAFRLAVLTLLISAEISFSDLMISLLSSLFAFSPSFIINILADLIARFLRKEVPKCMII